MCECLAPTQKRSPSQDFSREKLPISNYMSVWQPIILPLKVRLSTAHYRFLIYSV